tara:strand:- start:6554 stop:6775 length:222 start_codon:yes stop_codon:yes gene_type:complete
MKFSEWDKLEDGELTGKHLEQKEEHAAMVHEQCERHKRKHIDTRFNYLEEEEEFDLDVFLNGDCVEVDDEDEE